MTGSPGTISEQSSELGPINQKPPESTDVLRQFTKEQELSAMDYQQLLSDAEERAAELLAMNQQLAATLADVQERMAKLASENEHLYSKNEQLLCQLTAHSELLTTNEQLMATLAEVKERMERLGVENEQLKHELTVCSDSEALKKELQQGQNRIKELWKKNCEQVKEFNLIIWEKDRAGIPKKGATN